MVGWGRNLTRAWCLLGVSMAIGSEPARAADGVQDCGAVERLQGGDVDHLDIDVLCCEELCRLHALGEHGSP